MASKLCCTAEQVARSGSPELPNARLSGATPAKQPLLPMLPVSTDSRFTSVRSDELHELHQIFDHLQDAADEQATPTRSLRARFSRASIYSLHSLHKMTSRRSLLKRRFSRDLARKEPGLDIHIEATQKVTRRDQATIVKTPIDKAKQQMKITKEDLRKDLLSDKRADEGGYDSDAKILHDIARNVGKKTPSKRASIHSINWSPSNDSKTTPASSTKSRTDAKHNQDLEPYQVQKPMSVSLATRVSHVFSTPNFRVNVLDGRNRAFRRSQSATSIGLPQVSPISPISPLQLPGLTDRDLESEDWADTINESLRLTQFPLPLCRTDLPSSQTFLPHKEANNALNDPRKASSPDINKSSRRSSSDIVAINARPIEIRVQRPTSVATPRPSISFRNISQENTLLSKAYSDQAIECEEEQECDEEDNPRHSVHLHSMRISHHLRSGSLLSWEKFANTPQVSPSTLPYFERPRPDYGLPSDLKHQPARYERQTSSSGFASVKMPSRWGKVISTELSGRGDVASSIYSNRPQSPPESFVASSTSIAQTMALNDEPAHKSAPPSRAYRSHSLPADDEKTTQTMPRYEHPNPRNKEEMPTPSSLVVTSVTLARKNSVADTKKSKFHEEFSPSPPKKRIVPPESIMKLLHTKRLSGRTQSEASLKLESPIQSGDAAFDTLNVPDTRERRQSQSMMSLQTEQRALTKDKGADNLWDQALKAHQEEKACLFLPKNRDLATHASPFRERSGSIATRRSANGANTPISPTAPETLGPSAGAESPSFMTSFAQHATTPEGSPGTEHIARRVAMASAGKDTSDREISVIFEKQGDSLEVVGAWGRYPSHTRDERNDSAGRSDRVESRDFALEAAVTFTFARDADEDMIDPTERIPSMPLMPGEKKRKRKVGSGRMTKSNSMTFGKAFLKNYSKIFRSSSAEFRKHGRGHRSSIATGGVLEFPELELLPEGWKQGSSTDGSSDMDHIRELSNIWRRASHNHSANETQAHDSMATLRPRRNSSAPDLERFAYDGTVDDKHAKDKARVWSVYYDDCVPSYPRASVDSQAEPKDFGFSRFSFESQHPSIRSHAVHSRLARHSRNASHVSRLSIKSGGSAHASFKFKEEADNLLEKRSMVSVRRSTMDLLSKFKEQESVEREKILSITRAGSNYESLVLTAL